MIIRIEYDALGRQRVWTDGTNEERTVYRGAAWHRWGTRTTGTNPGAGYAPITHYLYDGSDVVADFASTGRGNFTLMKSYVSAGLDANLSVTHHAPVGDFLTTPIDPSGTGTGQGAGAGRGVGGGSQSMGSGLGGGRGGRGARGGLPTSFYHADGLGSIRTLTNEQGIVTNTRDYTAFGEARPSYVHPALGTDQRYTYTGREDSPLATSGAPMYYRYQMRSPMSDSSSGTSRIESHQPSEIRNPLSRRIGAAHGF